MHAVSGAISLPSRGAFHLSLMVLCTIGHPLVFSLGGWSPRLQAGFHVSRPTLRRTSVSCSLQACHLLWGGFPSRFARNPLYATRLGSSRFAHHYYGNLGASAGLCIHPEDTLARGFPHSDPPWSKALCASHGTFGAWPVLRRRRMPRHPPRAFLRLNPNSSDSALFCRMSSSNPPVFYWCFKSLCMLDCFVSFHAEISIFTCPRWDDVFCTRSVLPGAKETRTPNIQLAKLALYQLSYNP